MSKEKSTGIGFFQKYLTIWVILCMGAIHYKGDKTGWVPPKNKK